MTEDAVQPEDRHRSPYSSREKIGRVLWALTQATVFRCSFHTWYGWRRFLLRRFGASVHATSVIRRTVRVECPWNLTIGRNSCLGDFTVAYCLGPITLGARVSPARLDRLEPGAAAAPVGPFQRALPPSFRAPPFCAPSGSTASSCRGPAAPRWGRPVGYRHLQSGR